MGCNSTKYQTDEIVISPEQIEIARKSWQLLLTKGDLASHGLNMVIKIFTAHPEIKHLWEFAKDLNTEEQIRENKKCRYHGKRLFETIASSLKNIENPEMLDSVLFELGTRHYTYGAKPEYFVAVQAQFLSTLKDALSDDYTSDIEKAWSIIFVSISRKMIDGIQATEKQFQNGKPPKH